MNKTQIRVILIIMQLLVLAHQKHTTQNGNEYNIPMFIYPTITGVLALIIISIGM